MCRAVLLIHTGDGESQLSRQGLDLGLIGRVVGNPMARNVDAATHPRLLLTLHIVHEAAEGCSSTYRRTFSHATACPPHTQYPPGLPTSLRCRPIDIILG